MRPDKTHGQPVVHGFGPPANQRSHDGGEFIAADRVDAVHRVIGGKNVVQAEYRDERTLALCAFQCTDLEVLDVVYRVFVGVGHDEVAGDVAQYVMRGIVLARRVVLIGRVGVGRRIVAQLLIDGDHTVPYRADAFRNRQVIAPVRRVQALVAGGFGDGVDQRAERGRHTAGARTSEPVFHHPTDGTSPDAVHGGWRQCCDPRHR